MIGFGGMYQIKFLKNMNDLEKLNISRKISKPLKFEAGLGIALLAVVALLVNSSLPAGEIQSADAIQGTFGYESVLFSENAKFDVILITAVDEIFPIISIENMLNEIVENNKDFVSGTRYSKSAMTYEHNGESLVSVFHGQPNPHQSEQEWVKNAWK